MRRYYKAFVCVHSCLKYSPKYEVKDFFLFGKLVWIIRVLLVVDFKGQRI